jgi:uncharacterized YccA/Bax inhibitor family protein
MQWSTILWALFIVDMLLAIGVGIYGLMTSPTLVAVILTLIGCSCLCGLIVAGLATCCKREPEPVVAAAVVAV